MANNLIQIKRSTGNGTPVSLNPGELAYSNTSKTLFIGSTDGGSVVPIGGQKVPGTLTANQALVANSTSGIDHVIAANVDVLSYLTANGSPGTAGYALFSGGSTSNSYWASTGAFTTNASAQYTWSNTQTFTNAITFSTTIEVGAVGNNVTANTTAISIGNSTVSATINSTAFSGVSNNSLYLGGTLASGYQTTAGLAGNVAVLTSNNSLYLGGTLASGYQTTAGLAGNVATLTANNTSFVGTLAAASVANTSAPVFSTTIEVGVVGNNVTANTTTISIGNSTVSSTINSTAFTGTANNTSFLGGAAAASYQLNSTLNANIASYLPTYAGVVNATSFNVGTATIVNSSALSIGTVGATSGVLITNNSITIGNSTVNTTSNSTHFFTGNSTVYGFTNSTSESLVGITGNTISTPVSIVISNTTASVLTANLTGIYSTGTVNAATLSVGTAFVANSANLVFTGSSIAATGATMTLQNLTVSGNIVVSGTVTSINSSQLVVNDNIIELADGNLTTDLLDTGIYSPGGNSTATWYSGFARIATLSANNNAVFKLFVSNTNPNTASTIDNSSNTLTSTLISYLTPYGAGGAFVANSTVINITANATVSSAIVANSLSLSSALAFTSGGLGVKTAAAGDLFYAATVNPTALTNLSVGANGTVLQITNNIPAYGTLDGGVF